MKILQAQEVSKMYTIGERQIIVLDNVSFGVNNGEFLVVNGSSGSASRFESGASGVSDPKK